jgi:hypothetical protein
VLLCRTIVVKKPTAYIVLPHCTIWRICWVGLSAVVFRCGVVAAAVVDTNPEGGATPPTPWAAWVDAACAPVAHNARSPAAVPSVMTYFRKFPPWLAREIPHPGNN